MPIDEGISMIRMILAIVGSVVLTALPAAAQPTLYIANSGTDNGGGAVVQVPSGGGSFTTFATGPLLPTGLAIGGPGNFMYIGDGFDGRVYRVPLTGGSATLYATNLNATAGIAIDAAGTLYVADQVHQQIIKFPVGGPMSVLATDAPAGRLFGVALDSTGTNLYYTDIDIDHQGVFRVPTAGGTPVQLAAVSNPSGIVVTPDGLNLLVGSNTTANGTIREIPAGGGGSAVTYALVNSPDGLLLDGSGRLYVSSFGDNAVYQIPAGGGTPIPYATGFDTPYFMAFKPVPEPGSVLLACGVAGGLVAGWRRRSKVMSDE
jgi:hypothetical protein